MAQNPDKKSENRLSIGQLRAARALLGLTQGDLARRAGVGAATIKDYERGSARPSARSMAKIINALKAAGVRPIEPDEWGGEGVRMARGAHFAPGPAH